MMSILFLNIMVGAMVTITSLLIWCGLTDRPDPFPKFLSLGNWLRHIRECNMLDGLSDTTKVRLGYAVFLMYFVMLFAILNLWFIMSPVMIFLGINYKIKELVGVNNDE